MSDCYIQVAIPVPIRQLFTYTLPLSLQSPAIKTGERVLVPFGNRQVIGIVIDISQQSEFSADKVKPVLSRLHDSFHLSKDLVTFLQLCSHYYHHPVGDVFQQALPVLLRQTEKTDLAPPMVWHAKQAIDEQAQQLKRNKLSKAPKQLALLALIEKHQGISWAELRTLGYSKAQLNALVTKDFIEEKTANPTTVYLAKLNV